MSEDADELKKLLGNMDEIASRDLSKEELFDVMKKDKNTIWMPFSKSIFEMFKKDSDDDGPK